MNQRNWKEPLSLENDDTLSSNVGGGLMVVIGILLIIFGTGTVTTYILGTKGSVKHCTDPHPKNNSLVNALEKNFPGFGYVSSSCGLLGLLVLTFGCMDCYLKTRADPLLVPKFMVGLCALLFMPVILTLSFMCFKMSFHSWFRTSCPALSVLSAIVFSLAVFALLVLLYILWNLLSQLKKQQIVVMPAAPCPEHIRQTFIKEESSSILSIPVMPVSVNTLPVMPVSVNTLPGVPLPEPIEESISIRTLKPNESSYNYCRTKQPMLKAFSLYEEMMKKLRMSERRKCFKNQKCLDKCEKTKCRFLPNHIKKVMKTRCEKEADNEYETTNSCSDEYSCTDVDSIEEIYKNKNFKICSRKKCIRTKKCTPRKEKLGNECSCSRSTSYQRLVRKYKGCGKANAMQCCEDNAMQCCEDNAMQCPIRPQFKRKTKWRLESPSDFMNCPYKKKRY